MDPRSVDPLALAAALTIVSIALIAAGFAYSLFQRWWNGCFVEDPFDWEGDDFE